MRILLIYPPTTVLQDETVGVVPPLGLAYLAAMAEKEGHTVKILDALLEGCDQRRKERDGQFERVGLSWKEIEHKVTHFQPDLVGISCMFSYMNDNMHKVAGLVKNYDRNIPVIVGGAHSSLFTKNVLNDANIDFVVIGEGETTFVEFIRNLNEGYRNCHDVKGIAYSRKGKIIFNAPREPIQNLDDLPFPARHLLQIKEYSSKHVIHGHTRPKTRAYTSMLTSRGCPFQCTFCTVPKVWGRGWRARTPENVVTEIQELKRIYGIQEIHFEDDNISLDRSRMKRICELLIEKKVNVSWTTPNGIAALTLDKELISLMGRSGCYRLNFGIESADPFVLRQIRKPINLKQISNVIRWCQQHGIETCGFFIIGFPSDSLNSIRKTFSFAVESELDYANFNILVPFPATEIHKIVVERGLMPKDAKIETCRVLGHTTLRTEHLSAEELVGLQKELCEAFVRNRLRKEPLRVFLRSLKGVRSVKNSLTLIQSIFYRLKKGV